MSTISLNEVCMRTLGLENPWSMASYEKIRA